MARSAWISGRTRGAPDSALSRFCAAVRCVTGLTIGDDQRFDRRTGRPVFLANDRVRRRSPDRSRLQLPARLRRLPQLYPSWRSTGRESSRPAARTISRPRNSAARRTLRPIGISTTLSAITPSSAPSAFSTQPISPGCWSSWGSDRRPDGRSSDSGVEHRQGAEWRREGSSRDVLRSRTNGGTVRAVDRQALRRSHPRKARKGSRCDRSPGRRDGRVRLDLRQYECDRR